MTTQTYQPHWEMHGFTGEQHQVVREVGEWLVMACGLVLSTRVLVTGDYERGVDRCIVCASRAQSRICDIVV